ncbi:MAG: alpha/beta hydrolase [bacterium]
MKRIIILTLALCMFACAAGAKEPKKASNGTVVETISDKTIPLDTGLLYDADIPLETEIELKKETDTYKQYYVKYVSVNDQVVPALYLVPKGDGPFPAMLYMGGKGGKKEDMLVNADFLCGHGIAVLAPEPQYHGERKRENRRINSGHVFTTVRAIRQTILDFRRGLDFLETREEINQDAILYIGGSMGGILGAVICGVDKRIDACVLTVAGGTWTMMSEKNPLDPDAAELNEFRRANNLTWNDMQKFFDPVDPVNYIAEISPRPLLMVNGKNDIIVPLRASKNLYNHAKEPKEIWWLDHGHFLPYEDILNDIVDWYRKNVPTMGKQ